jgi:hypothetical protein
MQHPLLFDAILQQNQQGLTEREYLEQVAKQHPYFIPAQFYLLQQMQDTDAGYDGQAAKTAVLFNNPHWLNFQLQQVHTAGIIEEEDENISPLIIPEPAIAPIVETQKEPQTEEELMLAEDEEPHDEAIEMEEEIAPIKITLPNMEASPANENEPAFEPMHLVDYFASQGIKLSEEVQTADKLGKQLKSFTEWLKTMKKIHIPDSEASAGITDIAIQALAAKSNKEGEIVTEAMADVLVQQGKAAKAIEVYQKLSLLNPSKSAFFAAKIEQLKGS